MDGDDHQLDCYQFYKDADYNDGNITFIAQYSNYIKNGYPPGEYILNLRGTAISDPAYGHNVEVPLVFQDICDPPSSISVDENVQLQYTLPYKGTKQIFMDGMFSIDPPFCNFNTLLGASETLGMIPDAALEADIPSNSIFVHNNLYENAGHVDPGNYNLVLYAESVSQYSDSNANTTTGIASIKFQLLPEPTK